MPLGASASHIVGMQNGSVSTPPAYHELGALSSSQSVSCVTRTFVLIQINLVG